MDFINKKICWWWWSHRQCPGLWTLGLGLYTFFSYMVTMILDYTNIRPASKNSGMALQCFQVICIHALKIYYFSSTFTVFFCPYCINKLLCTTLFQSMTFRLLFDEWNVMRRTGLWGHWINKSNPNLNPNVPNLNPNPVRWRFDYLGMIWNFLIQLFCSYGSDCLFPFKDNDKGLFFCYVW